MSTLPVLYRDAQFVAVNKPPGMLVHRSPIDRHESAIAMQIVRDQLGTWVYPLHRLDKATSGVLLFALDTGTARAMTSAFSAAGVSKGYLAIVRGHTGEGARIDHPLKDPRRRMTGRERGDEPARASLTEYRRLAIVELPYAVGRYETARYSFVAVAPLTGRTHQIRRHMKHIFHPVVGDTTYGDGRQNEFFRRTFDCGRLLLHAHTMEFVHPATGERVSLRAPLSGDFSAVVEALKWGEAVPA